MPTINRPLAGGTLRFQLEEQLQQIRSTGLPERQGRSARTLIKDGPLRVVLIVLGAGESIPEHQAEGPITVAPVSGEITFHTDSTSEVLRPGDLLALGPGNRHTVDSATGGAFLLTIATPGEA
jgi:quercetin dioxygenase-like cupin family protein